VLVDVFAVALAVLLVWSALSDRARSTKGPVDRPHQRMTDPNGEAWAMARHTTNGGLICPGIKGRDIV